MPQIAALTIGTDTFKPFKRIADGVIFNNTANSPSVAVAPTLISQTVAPQQVDGVYRVKLNINVPVTCDSGVECSDVSVKSILRFKGEFLIPATSDATSRSELLELVKQALGNSELGVTVSNLESFY